MSNRRLAVVVAVDTYQDSALHRLAAPAADAAALAEVLGDERFGGFEVEVLHNETSWATGERIERILVDRHPGDLVLLHFSCHGLKDDAGELYLAAGNTRPDLLGSTAIEAAWVNRVMRRSRAQRIVLLLDCCYGGAFERGLITRSGDHVDVGDQFRQRDLDGGRGRVVITASTAMEYAFEGAQLTDGEPATPSVFTGALVEGIRTGAADRDQDGYVSLGELYDYVYDRVRAESPKQTPSKWEFGMRGGLYVARNPFHRPRPVAGAPGSGEAAAGAPPAASEPRVGSEASPASETRPEPEFRPAAEPSPSVLRSGRRSAVGGLVRPPPRGIVAVLVALLSAVAVAIWGDRDRVGGVDPVPGATVTSSAASPVVPSGPRDFAALKQLLPTREKNTCTEEEPNAPSTASADCAVGFYQLWNTDADMIDDMRLQESKPGSCGTTPGEEIVNDSITIAGRTVWMTCGLITPESAGSFYFVQWGIDNLLLTGSFYSARKPKATDYPPVYEKAIEYLYLMPPG